LLLLSFPQKHFLLTSLGFRLLTLGDLQGQLGSELRRPGIEGGIAYCLILSFHMSEVTFNTVTLAQVSLPLFIRLINRAVCAIWWRMWWC